MKVSRWIKTNLQILAYLAKWMSTEPHIGFTEMRVSGENVLQQGWICFSITMTGTVRPGETAVQQEVKPLEFSSWVVWVTLGESFSLCQSPFNYLKVAVPDSQKVARHYEIMLNTLLALSRWWQHLQQGIYQLSYQRIPLKKQLLILSWYVGEMSMSLSLPSLPCLNGLKIFLFSFWLQSTFLTKILMSRSWLGTHVSCLAI